MRAGSRAPKVRADVRRGVLIAVEVVLGVVAGEHPVAEASRAGVRRELAGRDLEEGALAGAVRADDGDALASQHLSVEPAVDRDRAVGLRHGLEAQHLPARARRLGEAEEHRVSMLADLDGLHPLEHLALALGLGRLGVLRAEALDERLELGAPRLLALGLGRQARLVLFPQSPVLVVVAHPAAHALRLEREHPLDLSVQEEAVVGDEQERLPRAAEEVLEPGERGGVEVVRGLVEEKEVGILEEEAREGHPHSPAA